MRALLLSLALFSVVSASRNTSAQDVVVEGPLANQPAVRNMRLYRELRLQVQPAFALTLQDEYSIAFQAGLQAHFHFTDWLGIGGFFYYALGNGDTDLTNEVVEKGISSPRNRLSLPAAAQGSGGGAQNFNQQVGRWNWNAGIQLDFIPFRGKLAFFEKLFVDTDLHFFAGVAFVSLSERANASVTGFGLDASGATNQNGNCGNPDDGTSDDAAALACLALSQSARSERIAIAATFGVGLTLYFNDWIGLNFEWRGMPFPWNTGGTDEGGSPRGAFPDNRIDESDRTFHFNQMLSIGVVIYLPPTASIAE